ncbi:MAG: response regulator transcription factor [Candidatus Sphingomonas colombiensis]|nr:response regulator transcription factor [Sphingomonas sp.]WEK43424.1 MAG: response regulator transcription factor [Sphingomonas sp.]
MRILLVDDEPLAIERMRVALAGVADVEVVGSASDGETAAREIVALDPDLVLLDIQMPGLTGMDLARQMVDAPSRPELVFVTAFNDFAMEAFDVEAVDYLLKPVSFDRLRMAIDRVRRRRALLEADGEAAFGTVGERQAANSDNRYDDGIWVPGRQGAVRVPIETIDRIEAARDYVLLNTPLRSYILRARMSEIERRIDPSHMVRIHRSHMVRIDSVIGVERPGKGALRLVLNDGANLQVGPNYQPQVVRALRL